MKLKRLLLISVCALMSFAYASALDFQYVGANNTKVTAVSGLGNSGYYLLYGNLGLNDANVGTPGGFYAGLTASGATASDACVAQFITVTDTTFYVYFPAAASYWKAPAAEGDGALTTNIEEAAPILVKASTNVTGAFTLVYTDANDTAYFFQDWGSKNNLGVYAPSKHEGNYDADGENDWFIYFADVKFTTGLPLYFSTANGLPAQSSAATVKGDTWKSPVIVSEDAISSFRISVKETAPGNGNRFYNYVFFCMSELTVFDADGNAIALGEDNFTSNSTETSEGAISFLYDGETTATSGDNAAFFHTAWGNAANIIAGEHYLEVTLPNPLYQFSFAISPRTNSGWGTNAAKNYPCKIGVSKGGEAFDFYPTYGMTVGEVVANDAVTTGKLYVMKSASSEEGLDLYPGYENGRRARKEARTDCVFSLVDAGDGSFYIKYYLRAAYVINPTADQAMTLNTSSASAGKFIFGADGTIKTAEGYGLYMNDDAGLAAKADTNIVWTIYEAGIDNSAALAQLKTAIDAATTVSEAYAGRYDDGIDAGEAAALTAALADANAMYTAATATSSEIIEQIDALSKAGAAFRALEILYLSDSIDYILLDEHFANEVGAYPNSQYTKLTTVVGDARAYFEGATYTSISEVEAYITTMNKAIEDFRGSIITLTVFPLVLDTTNGLPGTLTEAGGQREWTSPVFFLEEPIEKFRFTVTNNSNGDVASVGYYIFALSELWVYDAEGNPYALTVDNFYTNAQEPSEGPLENICDGITESANFFHTRWSAGGVNTGAHYLEITLPEPTNCFSFGYITRNLNINPTEMTLSLGKVPVYDSLGYAVGDKVLSAADLNTTNYYSMYGNYGVVSEGTDGSGFYNGSSSSGYDPTNKNLFSLEGTAADGYKIHFLVSDKYIANPTGSAYLGTTYNADEAGKFIFLESDNLDEAFKIYRKGAEGDTILYYTLQDWEGSLGTYSLKDWADDDVDGESDWFIYNATFTANPDSVKLIAAMNHAQAVGPLEGKNPGFYNDLSAYNAAFSAAVTLRYNGGSNADYIAARAALKTALADLGEYNKPEAGKAYTFVSAYWAYEENQRVKKAMYAIDETTLGWNDYFAEGTDSAQYMWIVEESDTAGYYFLKNVFTQTYIGFGTAASAVIALSETPSYYNFVLVGKGEFALHSKEGAVTEAGNYAYLHTGGHSNGAGLNGNIVFWSYSLDGATCWYLNEQDITSISEIDTDIVEVATTTYYTIGGKLLDAPCKGINIVKTVYSNGTSKVTKMLVK